MTDEIITDDRKEFNGLIDRLIEHIETAPAIERQMVSKSLKQIQYHLIWVDNLYLQEYLKILKELAAEKQKNEELQWNLKVRLSWHSAEGHA